MTLKVEDIQVLRQIWKCIDPGFILTRDTKRNSEQKKRDAAAHKARVARLKARLQEKEERLNALGHQNRLSRGEKGMLYQIAADRQRRGPAVAPRRGSRS